MLSQRINILHDVFQHLCKSLCNQQCIFLYQNIANRKTGGPGEDGSGNSHDLKIFEKTGGEPGGDRGGTGPSAISILFCKKHQYYNFEDFASAETIGSTWVTVNLSLHI